MPTLRNLRTGWAGTVTDAIARDRLRYPAEYELVDDEPEAQAERSTDLHADEAIARLAGMDAEAAAAFVDGDDRVTVQRAAAARQPDAD